MTSPDPPVTGTATAALRKARIPNADAIARLAEPSIRILAARVPSGSLPLGASRFGGSPDIPAGFAWPERGGRPLTFLAQLDLAALRVPDLPASGWLLFFYDVVEQPWGFDPADSGGARVVHLMADRAALARRPHPEVDPRGGPFESCALSFAAALDLPHLDDERLQKARVAVGEKHADAYVEVAAMLSGVDDLGDRYHHLLGNPQLIQGDMRGECQLVTRGIYVGKPDGYQGERTQELLRAAPSEWRLLLQLDSDEEGPGWMWGDSGRIYFWIRRTELAAGAFDGVWLLLQCG